MFDECKKFTGVLHTMRLLAKYRSTPHRLSTVDSILFLAFLP
uniref:Uncharacterized protein n=1 Tax=Parascaris equorum TaxID=6256 RepID=A0A914RWN5_PAREQ